MKHFLTLMFLLLAASLPAQNPNTAAFPTTVATDSDLLAAKRLSESTLSGTINSSTTSVSVADGTQFLQYAVIRIDNEEMKITGISSNTLTVTRAFNGTTAASHTSGAAVRGVITSYHHNQLAAELKAAEARLRDTTSGCEDAGVNDTYACNMTPSPGSYATGGVYRFKAATANTGAATVNFNALGAKTIKKTSSGITTDLDNNDIKAGQWVVLVYDGTNMQMASGSAGATGGASTFSDFTDCKITRASGSVVNIAACSAGVNQYNPTPLGACATASAPSSSGTMRQYLKRNGELALGFSGTNTTTCTGWLVETSIADFPNGSTRLGTVTWTSGSWNNDAVDERRFARPVVPSVGTHLQESWNNGVQTLDVRDTVQLKADAQAGTTISGTTTNTSTAYNLALTPTFAGYTDKQVLQVKFHTACGNNPTINVDGFGLRKLYKSNGTSAPAQISANECQATVYSLRYDSALDSGTGGFVLDTGGGSGGNTTYSNTYANLASTNCATGDAFFFQDSLYSAARCTATNTWGQIFVGGKLITVPPSNGSFTSETTGATGTYSLDNTGGTLNIKVGSDEATGVSPNYLAALVNSTTFTITIGVDVAVFGGTYPNFRFGVSTGTLGTSDAVTFAVGALAASGTTPSIGVQKMDNWVYNSWYWANNLQVGYANRLYMRIRQASGSRHFEYSRDGNTWQVHTTTTSTDHISSPTHYYFAASGNGVASIFHLTSE